nr:tetratricopeptide repeat protein [Campylobacter rectus]
MKKIIAVCEAPLNLLCAQINSEGAKAQGDAIVAYNEKRFKDAARLLKISCDKNIASSCFNLAFLYEEGEGVARDDAKAAQLYDKACYLGSASACNNLSIQYRQGRGVKKDVKKANDLAKKACDAGNLRVAPLSARHTMAARASKKTAKKRPNFIKNHAIKITPRGVCCLASYTRMG